MREKLPNDRTGRTRHVHQHGHELYCTVSLFPDGRVGEVFVRVAKEGSDIAGWVDAWCLTTSLALQHGVPWALLLEKAKGTRFGMSASDECPSLLHLIAVTMEELRCARLSG